jgi:hypothetical protein
VHRSYSRSEVGEGAGGRKAHRGKKADVDVVNGLSSEGEGGGDVDGDGELEALRGLEEEDE